MARTWSNMDHHPSGLARNIAILQEFRIISPQLFWDLSEIGVYMGIPACGRHSHQMDPNGY